MPRAAPRSRPKIGFALAALILGVGCIAAPKGDPDSTVVWGYVRLVPKAGSDALGGGYGDRRLADVERVDYSHTRYAVVFAASETARGPQPAELTIRDTARGPRLDPPFAATTPGAGVQITNATREERIVSVPNAGQLQRLEPGASARVAGLPEGESSVHLLGHAATAVLEPTQVWVTDGVTVEVEASGRYTLRGLSPGRHRLRAWHPRLPPSPEHEVELARGAVQRLDIEIGLDARSPKDAR